MNEADIAAIVYLCTRDAKFPVNIATEAYIRGQLRAVIDNETHIYSDEARAGMAATLARETCGI